MPNQPDGCQYVWAPVFFGASVQSRGGPYAAAARRNLIQLPGPDPVHVPGDPL